MGWQYEEGLKKSREEDLIEEVKELEAKLADYEKEFRFLRNDHSERFIDLTEARAKLCEANAVAIINKGHHDEVLNKLAIAVEALEYFNELFVEVPESCYNFGIAREALSKIKQ